MEDFYKTLEGPAEGMFKDRNSRFLAFGYPVDGIEEVNALLNSIRKRYHDARHHCYAYRIGTVKETHRQNDDGEPSGTAGKPIFNQILASDLTNVLVIVVRYFGGTLLGTGGLINAYRSAAADAIRNATLVVRFIEVSYELTFPYEKLSAIMKILKEENVLPMNPVYDVTCSLNATVRKSLADRFTAKISGISGLVLKLNE